MVMNYNDGFSNLDSWKVKKQILCEIVETWQSNLSVWLWLQLQHQLLLHFMSSLGQPHPQNEEKGAQEV